MDQKFREYHQFTDDEYMELWAECLFVFDTNVLLNMYRYSRSTVDAYVTVLKDLKAKNQLWIPYQVGYEFYENRIEVIQEFEKSYDEILAILDKAKADVESKYKNHPFLDLEEIKAEIAKGLSASETKIKAAKAKHPQWLKVDEVLAELDKVFEGCVGQEYDEAKLGEIKAEGKNRYDAKIPPGFQDAKKPEDRRYGDLILWFQIIDHAKQTKKPIILITGDVKEDWWLKKDGSRIMPLPQLKRELLNKAGVEFHIYTADRFLELYKSGEKDSNNRDDAVREVRKIRELEEANRKKFRIESLGVDEIIDRRSNGFYAVHIYVYESLQRIVQVLRDREIDPSLMKKLEFMYRRIRELRNDVAHGYLEERGAVRLMDYTDEVLHVLRVILRQERLSKDLYTEIHKDVDRIEEFLIRFKSELDRI